MICPSYDPITSHCAPSCCVCSRNRQCREKAAQGATNTLNGKNRTTTNDSVSIVRGGERICQA